ncbi:tetratricopeptide repeat protein [Teredinibacter sp. KSP-S5-2]|uniref:tetratricopeptide repeat protein n=1 Tax=Teredinibacter sp. KSP-S5-2 TaxID=3034506 RepID=UPI002934154A|nr:tetratricopeptide repeat protein [Teredinibacter sp. KSP-S5-2]WNO08078.1 tetratricopeptide repeat protein [Teredinibacter sp. KSP-S5-2]
MMKTNKPFSALKLSIAISSSMALMSCGSNEPQKATLRDIDFTDKSTLQADVFVKPKTEDEIKQAYYNYIQSASKDETSRQQAISRLAQMELQLSNRLIKESKEEDDLNSDRLYTETLNKTINLLTTSLRDYPKAKGNDVLLYQLAKTYDQVGEHNKAIEALTQLVKNFKNSVHYPEAQFRIAENAFVTGDYITAEDAYTEVIMSPDSDRFYEKAFFKRGWTRYKQELYVESVDDYLESLTIHKFGDYDALPDNEKSLFDEYFRAIGLAFSHLNGAESLQSYFASSSNFRYLYHTYRVIADIYLKQERYSDAVETLNQFVTQHADSKHVPSAKLSIIQIWQKGGFAKRVHTTVDDFYLSYHPKSDYWKTNTDPDIAKKTKTALRDYIVKEASFYHSKYQNKGKSEDYQAAKTWYDRYLEHYSSYSRQDNIYGLYAELLYRAKDNTGALKYFELAAYDGEIVLDKKAAYATVSISNSLYNRAQGEQKAALLDKHIRYASLYTELYPTDEKSTEIAINAAQLSFNSQQYDQAIKLTEALPETITSAQKYTSNLIKARSYFETKNFADAEATYQTMLSDKSVNRNQRASIRDNLALSIYRQGEQAKEQGDIAQASHHFVRVSDIAPNSDIASSGLYDAIALAMQHESWQNAIDFINRFKQLYPQHKYTNDVTRKLSVAYLKSNQGGKAAREFERISSFEDNSEVKMAALWQAAELYESKGDTESAIRSYRSYAHSYKKPFPQNMEAMQKLTELYAKQGDKNKQHFWQLKIAGAERRAQNDEKTERTTFIAASATLDLATQSRQEYTRRKLVEPIAANLRKKKKLMQDTIKLYGQASSFGLADITTQSTFSIGEIYRDFSKALLESERPKNLSEDELEQYEILLEDQAFPFEEKAIEFYETNLARSREGLYNPWLKQSREKLKELFPVRYSREGKLGGYTGNE